MTEKTFMQRIYDAAVDGASGANQKELKGVSTEQFLEAVKHVTDGLGKMPPETSMHAVLLAVTFVRNTLIYAMQHNQAKMETLTEANG